MDYLRKDKPMSKLSELFFEAKIFEHKDCELIHSEHAKTYGEILKFEVALIYGELDAREELIKIALREGIKDYKI
jgi:hypothetical protein